MDNVDFSKTADGSYLENFIFIEHPVALAMELFNVVGDCGSAIDGPVRACSTWHSEPEKVRTTSFLGLQGNSG